MRFFRIMLILCLLSSGCGREISRSEADKFAHETLEDYSKSHGLQVKRFSLKNVEVLEGGGWFYDYVYPDPPRQDVSIIVRPDGSNELDFSLR